MYGMILALTLPALAEVPSQSDRPAPSAPNISSYPTPPSLPRLQRPVPAARQKDMVLCWNEIALQAILTDRTAPPQAARILAMLHAAIYDAVNGVDPRHYYFYVNAQAPAGTSPEAAAAMAAHHILTSLYPDQAACFRKALDESLASIPIGEPRKEGIDFGRYVAERILKWRSHDGQYQRVNYRRQAAPGVWRPTPPDLSAPLLPQWPSVTCFCMRSGHQFRPAAPPPLTSRAYADDFNQVKALGGVQSTARSREQTEIAYFWADGDGTVTPPGHWNRIAQEVAQARGTRLAESARLFALLNLALADAAIACWDCKYHYAFWRPVTAIRQADPATNPATTPDPRWTPLLRTPPFPTYTSGHSTFSGAAAAMLADFFGNDAIRFTSGSDRLPGVTRSFSGFWAAAEEAGMSRIYGGIHYGFDNVEGLLAGKSVADYIFRNFLRPREVANARK